MQTPDFWNHSTVRDLERSSIFAFVQKHRGELIGRVLDFGCGKQPYRDLVAGEYCPFDLLLVGSDPALLLGPFDAILCTQVLQYIEDPEFLLSRFFEWIRPGGHLVMTYPTNWDEVETSDLWRFTKAGMERLLTRQGFEVRDHERRAEIELGGFRFPLGYGVIARRP